MSKLGPVKPKWHAEVAAEINREFAETNELNEKARHRRARLGLMFVWVKAAGKADGSIPHGKFGDWLEANCSGIPRRTVGDYLTEANSICDLLGWQNGEIRHFEVPPHRLLSAPADDLKGEAKVHQKELLKVIEQQKQFRAVTQYKQVELVDDATVARRGRVPGEGGKRALTASEKLIKTAEQANAACKEMQALAVQMGAAFCALPDDDLEAHLHFLDTHTKAIRHWLNTPTPQRDAKATAALLKF